MVSALVNKIHISNKKIQTSFTLKLWESIGDTCETSVFFMRETQINYFFMRKYNKS